MKDNEREDYDVSAEADVFRLRALQQDLSLQLHPSSYAALQRAIDRLASIPGEREVVAWRFVTSDGDKYEWQDISDKPSYVREVGGEVIYEMPPPNMTIEYAYTHPAPAVAAPVVTEALLRLMPETIAALRSYGAHVSLVADLERAIKDSP